MQFAVAQQESNFIKDLEYYNTLKVADNLFKNASYSDAIFYYDQLYKYRNSDAQIAYKLGVCIVEAGKFKLESIPYLKQAIGEGIHSANYYLGKAYHIMGNFEMAKYCYDIYKTNSDKNEQKRVGLTKAYALCDTAEYMIKHPKQIEIRNIGSEINTEFSEYGPVFTGNMSELYFTSRREGSKGNQVEADGQFYEDIWMSRKSDNQWLPAENGGSLLNSNEHDAIVTITPDGNEALIYRSDPYSGEDNFYSVKRSGKEWSIPLKLSINVNSPSQELSATLSNDGQILIFSSNRKGGFGGFDLYKSERKRNGVFGPAVNLGPTINTSGNEESPFLHANGRNLYFSSNGHASNMGGYDVYLTTFNDSLKWSKPMNLGYPLNTTDDDLYFSLSADMMKGYISGTRKGTLGDHDIFEVAFKEDTSGLTLVQGNVYDTRDSKNIEVEINIYNKENKNLIYTSKSNGYTGNYSLIFSSKNPVIIKFSYSNTFEEVEIEGTTDKKFRNIIKDIKFGN
ncbi:MAG: hypothetical protein SFY32_15490 [Bacteroidota bacterium]|nr:hypothetical protein [Bacteroidota bacterium]